jgi:hypothetical protein
MLATDSWTVAGAIESVESELDEIADQLVELEPGTKRYEALASTGTTLDYQADGLEWHRDDWGDDAEIVLGCPTAGQHALIDRHADTDKRAERVLWLIAAATEEAPYSGDDIQDTFSNVANLHDGAVRWLEARINDLSAPEGKEGNRLRRRLQAKKQTEG